MHNGLEYLWYKNRFLGYLLFPVALFFSLAAIIRKRYLQSRLEPGIIKKPVIVVGNITVGGTGKTPLVIAIVKHLQASGCKPGVISRGYGGVAQYPLQLNAQTRADESGDEPLLIYQRCGCPVVVSPLRVEAAQYLIANNDIDIIVSDDGLQHYALPRDIEIVVIDGQRGLGNGLCLPAGPLREPARRLASADFVLVNGIETKTYDPRQTFMKLRIEELQPLEPTRTHRGLPSHSRVNAVAAIGNPQRFFSTLEQQGYNVIPRVFPDHYLYQEQDLLFENGLPVVMTEKDAIKCTGFNQLDQHWFLPVNAVLPYKFWKDLDKATGSLLKKGEVKS
jgi:tetraacyldisaccharide 4'-kinase